MIASALAALLLTYSASPAPCDAQSRKQESAIAAMTRRITSTLHARLAQADPADQARAQADQARMRADQARMQAEAAAASHGGQMPVHIEDGSSIDDAVQQIAQTAGWNLVVDSDAAGEEEIPGEIRNLPASEALRQVLSASPLMAVWRGPILVVSRNGSTDPAVAVRGPMDPAVQQARVTLRERDKVDDALTRMVEKADLNLVDNTGAEGEHLLVLDLHGVALQDALAAVIQGTNLHAVLDERMLTVTRSSHLPDLSALPAFPGRTLSLDGNISVDDALERIADSAELESDLSTGGFGDKTLRVSLHKVPLARVLQSVLTGSHLSAAAVGGKLAVGEEDEVISPPAAPQAPDALSGKKISLDVENDTVDDALQALANKAGVSVVESNPDPSPGRITLHLRDVPFDQAVQLIATEGHLSVSRTGNVLMVRTTGGSHAHHRMFTVGKGNLTIHTGNDDADDDDTDVEVDSSDGDEDEPVQGLVMPKPPVPPLPPLPPPAGGPGSNDRVLTGDVSLAPGEEARTLVAIHGSARLGPGSRALEVTAVGGSVDIAPGAHVDHEVTAIGGDVKVGPGAYVGKGVTTIGGHLVISPGADVRGERTSIALPGAKGFFSALTGFAEMKELFSPLLVAGRALAEFALFFALGLVVLMFWPRRLDSVVHALEVTPARSAAVGLLSAVAAPLLALLLTITLVGIPLAIAEVFAVAVSSVLGFTGLATIIGRRIPMNMARGASIAHLAAGTAAMVVAMEIPILGRILVIMSAVVVLGAVIGTRFGQPTSGSLVDSDVVPPDAPISSA